MSSLTDSAVRSGETGGALAPEPVDSVHADPTVVTEGAKKLTDETVHPFQLQQSTSIVCLCGGVGGVTRLSSTHQYKPPPFKC